MGSPFPLGRRGSMVGRICATGAISFKSGMEERGSDGWCDGGDR